MARSAPRKSLELLGAAHKSKFDTRLGVQEDFVAVRKLVPPDARILLHEMHNHLGIGVERVHDDHLWQYGINYAELETPGEVYDLFRSLGVTHVLWERSDAGKASTLSGDLLFYDFAYRRLVGRRRVGRNEFGTMPPQRPEGPFDDRVAVVNCRNDPPPGLYRLRDLALPAFGPAASRYPKPLRAAQGRSFEGILASAGFALVDPRCKAGIPLTLERRFIHVTSRKRAPRRKALEIWLRRE